MAIILPSDYYFANKSSNEENIYFVFFNINRINPCRFLQQSLPAEACPFFTRV